ncbi:MAG: OsmC family protein [Tepidisphaeraceae bacterium]
MPVKSADAEWNGTLVDGSGHIKGQSGKIDTAYSWKMRAEDGSNATSPEELIAAAHAGCYSMALSHILTGAGFPPKQIKTNAKVSFEKQGDGFAITGIALSTAASIPNIDAAKFKEIAEMAKAGCPVSKALASVNITLDAKLV